MRPVDIVQPIEAGQVRFKEAQRAGRGPLLIRHWYTMLSREWTPVLPIYSWLIDHPEGTLVVDTGPEPSEEWSYPRYHFYYPLAYRERVGPAGGLEAELAERGLTHTDVDATILTHCHPDHAGGFDLLPGVPTYIYEPEVAYARSLRGRFWGSHPAFIPPSRQAEPVSLTSDAVGPFERSFHIPGFPGVSLVPTPGHTAHHCSVVVEGDGPTVCLAADACLSLDQLDTGRIDGVATRGRAARETLDRIDRWRRDDDVIVLPSHDPRGRERLLAAR